MKIKRKNNLIHFDLEIILHKKQTQLTAKLSYTIVQDYLKKFQKKILKLFSL